MGLWVAASGGCSVAVCRLLIAVSSLVVEHRLQARGLQWLWDLSSAAAARRLRCFAACGIFPCQGSNLSPRHWQAESVPLYYQGSPKLFLLFFFSLSFLLAFHLTSWYANPQGIVSIYAFLIPKVSHIK